MKKTLVVGLAIGLVSMASFAFAGASANMGAVTHTPIAGDKNVGGSGIVGSSHDLSNVGNKIGSQAAHAFTGTGDAQKRICVYCHHPHNAFAATGNLGSRDGATGSTLDYSPLWNRNMSTTTFAGYDNGIMMGAATVQGTDKRHALNAADAGGTSITGVSLLCMSCHDGVVAMNAFSQTTGSELNKGNTATGGAITSTAGFKGDMNNHHPMGFNYVTVQAADAEIAATTVKMNGNTTIGDLLYGSGNTMECVTCHDVHNTANQAGAERFLWRTNDKSNFCLTCHLK